MALANGAYPFTLTATQANGTSYSLNNDLIIGDDVIVVLGIVSNTVELPRLELDLYVSFTAANESQTAEDLVLSNGSELTIALTPVTETMTANDLSMSIGVSFPDAPILSVTQIRASEVFTVTVDTGVPDLTTMTVTATFGGVSLGSGAGITATTVNFTAPVDGLQLGINYDLIVSVI